MKYLDKLQNSISTISSKVMKEVQFKINNPNTVTMDELEERLKDKVGSTEFVAALESKTNKDDMKTAMNSIGTNNEFFKSFIFYRSSS